MAYPRVGSSDSAWGATTHVRLIRHENDAGAKSTKPKIPEREHSVDLTDLGIEHLAARVPAP